MYSKEEQLVKEEFLQEFRCEFDLLTEILDLYETLLFQVKAASNEYNTYAAAILAGLNIKASNSAFDRLTKGYLSDSEAILKKFIESFLAEVFLFEHPVKAKEWVGGKKIKKLGLNRREMAQALDSINEQKKIFPTDYPDFFESYIYEVGYTNSNKVAHLDFDFVHQELGLENDPTKFANTLVVGPKFDKEFMKTIVARLIMFTMFQVSYLKETFKLQCDKKHSDLLNRVINRFGT